MSDTIAIVGLDDLEETFSRLAAQYPDRAGDMLRGEAFKFRNGVAKRVREQTDTEVIHKQSLGKGTSYKVSEIKGTYQDQYVEISAKSPHFHLVENGHMMVTHTGDTVGFVPGYHFMDIQSKKEQEEMPEVVDRMITKMLKAEGLI